MKKNGRKGSVSKAGAKKGRGASLAPRVETGLKKATLFMNGRSQAVRLPKEFRFKGTHVLVRKDGNRVILMPEDDRMERLLAAFGSSPDFPDIPRDPPAPMRPEIKEYFGVSD
jgi:antitoxin VapB